MSPMLHLIMGRHRCPHCVFRKFFVAAGFDCQLLDEIGESVTKTYGPYATGELIYRAADVCDSLYVVQSGSVKTEMNTDQGGAHVNGFYLAGEMFGFDGISEGVFPSAAVAMERTTVCTLKLSKWNMLCETYPSLQTSLVNELADIVRQKNNELMYLHHLRVEDRILIFLRNLLSRERVRRGQLMRTVPLAMSQTDIARYLCITPETLSRCLKRLEATGVICKHKRSIEFLDDDREMGVGT